MTDHTRANRPQPFRMLGVAAVIAAPILLFGSCSPPPEPGNLPAAPTAAEGTAERTTERSTVNTTRDTAHPQVVLPDGFEVRLELAVTPDELAQGLMFRPHLPADRGMLLIFAEERLPNIWMMNTLVALDLVYLDSAGRVVDIVTDAQPCPGEPCPRFTPKHAARAVLEVPAGSVGRHQIAENAVLEFANISEFPVAD